MKNLYLRVILFVCTFSTNEILQERVITLPFTDVKFAEMIDLPSYLKNVIDNVEADTHKKPGK